MHDKRESVLYKKKMSLHAPSKLQRLTRQRIDGLKKKAAQQEPTNVIATMPIVTHVAPGAATDAKNGAMVATPHSTVTPKPLVINKPTKAQLPPSANKARESNHASREITSHSIMAKSIHVHHVPSTQCDNAKSISLVHRTCDIQPGNAASLLPIVSNDSDICALEMKPEAATTNLGKPIIITTANVPETLTRGNPNDALELRKSKSSIYISQTLPPIDSNCDNSLKNGMPTSDPLTESKSLYKSQQLLQSYHKIWPQQK